MINDDILVKYARNREKSGQYIIGQDWVEYVKFLKSQILTCKLGFPGFSDSDLSLITPELVISGARIILDDNLDANCGFTDTDHAPILGLVISRSGDNVTLEIEGIGAGLDFTRDPDRLMTWGQMYTVNINNWHLILRLDTKPRPNGGPVYYYYERYTRDSRW